MRFTAMVEKERNNLDKLSKFVEDTLQDLVSCDQSDELQRYTVRSLIIEYVRFRLVVKELHNPGKWSWEKQLRFYYKSGMVIVRLDDCEIPY